ncbi:MAG: J domain-containing protein [Microthrixaceae bacterium]
MRTGHYEVLGVAPDASPAQLKAAYRARLKVVHPDSGGSEEDFEALQVAWSVVGDPHKRREYDRWLADVTPVMGGSRLAVQQRFEERELAAERAAWEARRAEARRRADERAAREAAEQAARAQLSEHLGTQRHLVLGVAALVVVVSLFEMLAGPSFSSPAPVLLGVVLPLPPAGTGILAAQLVAGVLLAAASVLSAPPPSGADTPGPSRFVASRGMRITIDAAAWLLALVVLVPFVLTVL